MILPPQSFCNTSRDMLQRARAAAITALFRLAPSRDEASPAQFQERRVDSIQVTDKQSADVAKTDDRVTLANIEDAISQEYSFTLGDAVICMTRLPAPGVGSPLHFLTMHVIVMKNGFVVTGESAPADPLNFNPELGAKFARENAIRKIWPLMGFALRDRLANA